MIKNFEHDYEDISFDEVLEIFNLKIKKSLYNTAFHDREDVEQEIKLKLYEKFDVIKEIKAPGFFEFLSDKS
ncbi:hypothetical protein ACFWM3_06325 [Gottfriedia sp. NPDC058432]|uniref:hypothetical protein n=1 Tax=Gottfriedia sp. NPDC058432 TaxID=3346497 RepID=UPI00364C8544